MHQNGKNLLQRGFSHNEISRSSLRPYVVYGLRINLKRKKLSRFISAINGKEKCFQKANTTYKKNNNIKAHLQQQNLFKLYEQTFN